MKSIQPVDPGGPNAPPQYVWDGYDGGQVWLAKQAKAYGVKRFFADAWSAPGYMKTNGSALNGGQVCGTTGASCGSGDWRQAYANYLVQYAKDYAAAGVPLTYIGPSNEPDYSASYDSITMSWCTSTAAPRKPPAGCGRSATTVATSAPARCASARALPTAQWRSPRSRTATAR